MILFRSVSNAGLLGNLVVGSWTYVLKKMCAAILLHHQQKVNVPSPYTATHCTPKTLEGRPKLWRALTTQAYSFT